MSVSIGVENIEGEVGPGELERRTGVSELAGCFFFFGGFARVETLLTLLDTVQVHTLG